MILFLILTAVVALAVGWCWGHRIARIRIVVIGGAPWQDHAAIAAAETARFWQIVQTLDLPDTDNRKDAA